MSTRESLALDYAESHERAADNARWESKDARTKALRNEALKRAVSHENEAAFWRTQGPSASPTSRFVPRPLC